MDSEQQPLGWFDHLVTPFFGLIAALLLLCLMAVTCVDVIGRYFLGAPLYGAFEITEMLLASLIFAGLPLVTLRNDHITVDLLDAFVSDSLFRIQHVVICLICFAATAYLAWRLGVYAVAMDRAGETTAQLRFKLAYLTYAMSLLMALTAVALLVLAMRRPQRHRSSQI